MTLESVLATLFVMLLYVLKPGPSIIAMISRSLSDGFQAGVTGIRASGTGIWPKVGLY